MIGRSEVWPRPVNIHIAHIDTRAKGIRFKVTPSGGAREVIRQTTLSFLRAERAQDVSGGSGMRLGEIAALLRREYGVWDAITLDGGGSTTMAWENPDTGETALVKTSSDLPDGRTIASTLAVFARRH